MMDGRESGKEFGGRGVVPPRLILHLLEDTVDLGPDQGQTHGQNRDRGHSPNRLCGGGIERERRGIVRCLLMGAWNEGALDIIRVSIQLLIGRDVGCRSLRDDGLLLRKRHLDKHGHDGIKKNGLDRSEILLRTLVQSVKLGSQLQGQSETRDHDLRS